MIVHLTDEAIGDLERIGDRIGHDNPARAISFIQKLRARCVGLADYPERFPLVPRYEQHGVRSRVYGNYLIFYLVETDRVVVIHILHGAMDYAEVLFPS